MKSLKPIGNVVTVLLMTALLAAARLQVLMEVKLKLLTQTHRPTLPQIAGTTEAPSP